MAENLREHVGYQQEVSVLFDFVEDAGAVGVDFYVAADFGEVGAGVLGWLFWHFI